MGVMVRQRESEIQNGQPGDAGDVDAELDHIVAQHNDSEGRLVTAEADVTATQGDVTTLQGEMVTVQGEMVTIQGEMVTAQADIVALEETGLSGVTVINTSRTLLDSDEGQIFLNSPSVMLTLPIPTSFSVGRRWIVYGRFTGSPSFIHSNYSAPDADGDVAIRDGDMVMITVVDDVNYAGANRYNVVMLPAALGYFDDESISTNTTYTKADLPRTVYCTANLRIDLPPIEAQMVGREVMICNAVSPGNVVLDANADQIIGGGFAAATYSLLPRTTAILRIGPGLNWLMSV